MPVNVSVFNAYLSLWIALSGVFLCSTHLFTVSLLRARKRGFDNKSEFLHDEVGVLVSAFLNSGRLMNWEWGTNLVILHLFCPYIDLHCLRFD